MDVHLKTASSRKVEGFRSGKECPGRLCLPGTRLTGADQECSRQGIQALLLMKKLHRGIGNGIKYLIFRKWKTSGP